MKITVQNRPSYGKDRIYPVDDAAQTFAKFTGKVTFNEADLETIRKLGFTVEYAQLDTVKTRGE